MHTYRVLVLVMSLGLAACGKEDDRVATYDSPEGEITVQSEEGGKVARIQVQGEEGDSRISIGHEVTAEDIGIVFYPDAEPADTGGFSMQTEAEGGMQTTMATLKTDDDIDKVVAFYKQEYADAEPEVSETNMPGHRMTTLIMEKEGRTLTIMMMANAETGGTDIQLMRAEE